MDPGWDGETKGGVGHPLEAKVQVKATGSLPEFLADKWETLKMISIVSELMQTDDCAEETSVSEVLPELHIAVIPASGGKCERCWLRSEAVGNTADHPELCSRCTSVVSQLV
jgi:isoleucyl-tRNA synthetase